jgi:hypothetical protein
MAARYLVAPEGAAAVARGKGLEAVEVDVLGKALVDQPGPAAGQHHPAVFGVVGVEIGGEQGVVATGECTPGDRRPQHRAAAVGREHAQRLLEQLGPSEHPLHPRLLRPGQQQQGCFGVARGALGLDRQPQAHALEGFGGSGRQKQAEEQAVGGAQAFLDGYGAVLLGEACPETAVGPDQEKVAGGKHDLAREVPRPLPRDHPGFRTRRVKPGAEGGRVLPECHGGPVRVDVADVLRAAEEGDHLQGFRPQALVLDVRRHRERIGRRGLQQRKVGWLRAEAEHLAGCEGAGVKPAGFVNRDRGLRQQVGVRSLAQAGGLRVPRGSRPLVGVEVDQHEQPPVRRKVVAQDHDLVPTTLFDEGHIRPVVKRRV